MQEALYNLVELQKIDTKLKEIDELRGNLPQEVERLGQEISEIEKQISEYNKRIEEIDLEIRDQEGSIAQANEKVKKYQDQLYAVKTNKEYDALTHELEAMLKAISESENITLDLMTEKEQKQEANDSASAAQEDLTNELENKKAELKKKVKATRKEEKEFHAKRVEMIPKVNKSLLSRYEKVRKARNGLAVVSILRNACGGCFHGLPPQVVVEIKRMYRIVTCEQCGRMLVAE